MRIPLWIVYPLLIACFPGSALGQFKEEASNPTNVELGQAQTQSWKAGMELTAVGGPCLGIKGYVPMPVNWPEQRVTIVEEDIAPAARISYRNAEGGMKLMVISVPRLPSGQKATATVTLEIERHVQLPPEKTDQFVIPTSKQLGRDLRIYLGASPYIESRHGKIKKLAKQVGADEPTAWEQIEAIYDWVREEVEYKKGPLKGALAALRDKTGDCEELASLFIAICRAKGVPARTVWVPRPLLCRILSRRQRRQRPMVPLSGGREPRVRRDLRVPTDPPKRGQLPTARQPARTGPLPTRTTHRRRLTRQTPSKIHPRTSLAGRARGRTGVTTPSSKTRSRWLLVSSMRIAFALVVQWRVPWRGFLSGVTTPSIKPAPVGRWYRA